MKKYSIQIKTYTKTGLIDSPVNINSITFVNSGAGNVKINESFILAPGDTLKIEGNENEIDVTKYKLTFETPAGGNVSVFTKQFNDVQ